MTTARELSLWALWLAPAVAGVFAAKGLLHFFQLGSYQFASYAHTLRRQWRKAWAPGAALSLAALAVTAFIDGVFPKDGLPGVLSRLAGAAAIAAAGWLAGAGAARKKRVIKPFQMTVRVKRLYGVLTALLLLLAAGIRPLVPVMGAGALLPFFLPLWVALAGLAAWPVEKLLGVLYLRDAKAILGRQEGLVRVGITGSYGKTSVKFILKELLSQRFPVLATRKSFNTPMGVTRCIREDLRPEHRVFIAEMGARHRRDIRDLCRLVRPQIGVITSVGPQHLETFRTIENVRETKFDLIRALPEDGFAVFYDDGGICRDLYERSSVPKAIVGSPGSCCWAEDAVLTGEGSRFTLCMDDGTRLPCSVSLPGEHSIRNILLACAAARRLGVTALQMQRGLLAVRPVESRLEPLRKPNGVLVINNGFNASPEGSEQSLKLLQSFPGRKAVVTPGFVELGAMEDEYNRRLGRGIAGCAQEALLVGPRHTRPILEGLREAGFPEERIHVFLSLKEANHWLTAWEQAGDVILYENDLPDHYSES